ncbi:helicase-related protein, partial [uncultured Flavonifractor sp.]|uniref:helicase-related protein n=1 Tax=uncultured Flavonifractor sp. TaxID=1193534 RepID=UPI0025967799
MTHMAGADGFALLTSETKAKERRAILGGLADGSISILIGTHSVLSPSLVFQDLALTIVDEEHRFGAEQKELLASFDKAGTHHLSMTATPIPRSYASSVYGGCLDIITIQTMPKGRKPVITSVEHDRQAVYQKLLVQARAGHQAYVVCPFIEESESEKFKDVLSVKTVVEELQKFLKANAPEYQAVSISGDMKQKEVLAEIDRFARNEVQFLVSTTIVEVGVNVPNATGIAIMNAERFGLAALHQLRGRVGRKGDQGYCYLVSEVSNEKLAAMTMYSSGFKIAEVDLQLRGPGDILGIEQTGDSKVVSLILKYPKLAGAVRRYFEDRE